jgi:Cu/Ag efflux protein CusF
VTTLDRKLSLWLQIAAVVALCSWSPANVQSADAIFEDGASAPAALVTGLGVVVATHPQHPALTVNHEEIKGFMEAMEMMYYVQSVDMLDGLKPGDKIRFTIDTRSPPKIKKLEVLGH